MEYGETKIEHGECIIPTCHKPATTAFSWVDNGHNYGCWACDGHKDAIAILLKDNDEK